MGSSFITPTLSKTWHQLCKTSQVAYVCHHVHYTWHHIHPLRKQPLVFMTSHALYWWHHMQYIWHGIYCVWYHIHYMCGITQCLYLWHHTLYVSDISTLYGITHNVITTQPLCKFIATMSDITPTLSVSSQPVDQFYHNQCIYDITATMCMTSYALHVTSHSQLRTSHHFMYVIMSTLSDLTSTVSLSSHPPYRWYHSHCMYDLTSSISVTSHPLYIYDIISTKYDITTLCVDDTTLGICMTSFAPQMTSHPLYHIKPQYLWCHIHFRHDIACTVSLSSQPLHWYHTHFCMTSHPPSMWHHMNYI